MSNTVNFREMPVSYGLIYAFDCNTFAEGAGTWKNSVSGGVSATVVGGTVFMDGSVFFAKGNNFAYWVNSESYTDSTKYFIAKEINGPSTSEGYWGFTERGSSYKNTTDIDVYGSNKMFMLYASGSNAISSVPSSDYHIIATTKSGTTATIYIDGVQAGQLTGKDAFVPTNYGIGTGSSTGSVPTANDDYDLYVKCALVCKAAHSEGEILRNSNWLLEQYGLKEPAINSRLAGSDAVAIAYAIARNQESATSLQEMKEAYKDGIKQGLKDGSESTENITEDLPPNKQFDVKFDEEGNVIEPFIGDMENGIFLTGGSGIPDGGYLKIYLDKAYEKYYETSDTALRGRLIFELYDENGNITATEWRQGAWGWMSYSYNAGKATFWITKFRFHGEEVMGYSYEAASGITYYSEYWSPTTAAIKTAMANATTLSSVVY